MEASYRLSNPVLHYGLLVFIYTVGALTLATHAFMMGHMDTGDDKAVVTAGSTTCSGSPAHTYTMAFTKAGFVPDRVTAARCDELVIRDTSPAPVLAALGPHDHHIEYPGFKETTIQPGQHYGFRLNEAGTFPMHDHLTDLYHATLTVTKGAGD